MVHITKNICKYYHLSYHVVGWMKFLQTSLEEKLCSVKKYIDYFFISIRLAHRFT